MNIRLLSIWMRNNITAYPVTITQAPDANGSWADTEVLGDAIKGVKYNSTAAGKYFNIIWAEDVTDVFVTDDIGAATTDGTLRINGDDYQIDSIVDTELQGDVYQIGLRRAQ